MWRRKKEEVKTEDPRIMTLKATRGQPLKNRLLAAIEQDTEVLSTPCYIIPDYAPEIKDLVIDELMVVANEFKAYCAGLSANQVGYPFKAFVVKQGKEFVPYINTEILARGGGVKRYQESCLSRVGQAPVSVRRHKTIQIKYWCPVRSAEITEWILDRKIAQCIQHEIDHGNGILI